MRLLHTSDWHLGRSLHGHDLGPAQAGWVDYLVDVVRAERIDVVLIAGDVHDRALPPVEALGLFADALARLRDAGATVVAISGNHDAPSRLGDKAGLLDPRVQIRTDPARVGEPVLLADRNGPVAIYGVPYLEPAAVRDRLPGDPEATGPGGAHARVLGRALAAIGADRAARGARAVVLAHAWVTGAQGSESERDITVGGVAHVPAALFDGIDYGALGHLHRPQTVREGLRYSGSPLAYSFSEAGTPKASWLVELDAAGLRRVEAVPAPVPRALSALRGTLEELLTSPRYARQMDDFVSVVLTDVRPRLDAMAAVQRRFPYALTLRFEPAGAAPDDASYGSRTRGLSDLEVAVGFLAHVRGCGADGAEDAVDEAERALLAEALEAARVAEAAA